MGLAGRRRVVVVWTMECSIVGDFWDNKIECLNRKGVFGKARRDVPLWYMIKGVKRWFISGADFRKG